MESVILPYYLLRYVCNDQFVGGGAASFTYSSTGWQRRLAVLGRLSSGFSEESRNAWEK